MGTEGLAKPSDLNEVQALHEKVHTFEKTCLKYLKVLSAASDASKKMTTRRSRSGGCCSDGEVQQGQGCSRRMGWQGRHIAEGMDSAGQHRHRAEHLGCQGQIL